MVWRLCGASNSIARPPGRVKAYVGISLSLYIYIYVYVCVCMYMYMCVYVYVYVYVYICVCICVPPTKSSMLVINAVFAHNAGIPRKSGFQGSLYLSRESLGNCFFTLFQNNYNNM
jgi:uncharacterized membrane protein